MPFTLKLEDQAGWGRLLVKNEKATIEVPVISLDKIFFQKSE